MAIAPRTGASSTPRVQKRGALADILHLLYVFLVTHILSRCCNTTLHLAPRCSPHHIQRGSGSVLRSLAISFAQTSPLHLAPRRSPCHLQSGSGSVLRSQTISFVPAWIPLVSLLVGLLRCWMPGCPFTISAHSFAAPPASPMSLCYRTRRPSPSTNSVGQVLRCFNPLHHGRWINSTLQ
jgi:hypothetical protein